MIKNRLKRLSKSELIRTSYYTGTATVLQTLSGIVVTKIVAVFIGPSGVAIISQFQNFISLSTAVATGGTEQGVVKYVSEFETKPVKLKLMISTAFKLNLFFAIASSLFILLFANHLSEHLFNSNAYRNVLLVFGGTIFLFSMNRLLMSILNGTREIKKLVAVKYATSIFALVFTSLFTYLFGVLGALYALGVSQAIVFFISLYFVTRCSWFNLSYFTKRIDKELIIKYLRYSLMSLSSMIMVPLVSMGIRNYLVQNISIQEAGLWDAMNRVSNAYLGIITTTLGYYYLPKLSSLSEKKLLDKEIINGYKIILPVVVLIILVILLLRKQIIFLLFSNEFIGMERLFFSQSIGDFFKIASFLLSYLMLAKSKVTLFIVTQVVFLLLLYFSSIMLIDVYGVDGAIYANATNYFFYFLAMLTLYRFNLLT